MALASFLIVRIANVYVNPIPLNSVSRCQAWRATILCNQHVIASDSVEYTGVYMIWHTCDGLDKAAR